MNSICLKAVVSIRVEGLASLKEKRSVITRTKNVLTRIFQLSIIESHDQDALQYIGFSLCFISHHPTEAQSRWERIQSELEKQTGGWLESEEVQML